MEGPLTHCICIMKRPGLLSFHLCVFFSSRCCISCPPPQTGPPLFFQQDSAAFITANQCFKSLWHFRRCDAQRQPCRTPCTPHTCNYGFDLSLQHAQKHSRPFCT